MNLANSKQDYFFSADSIFQQQKTANVTAANQRIAAPSVGGLMLELGGAALSGVMAAVPFKAPPAGNINQLGSVAKANNVVVKPGFYGPAF